MHPADDTDAAYGRIRLLADSKYFIRRGHDGSEDNSSGYVTAFVQDACYLLRMIAHMAERFFAVQVLTACKEPYFQLL